MSTETAPWTRRSRQSTSLMPSPLRRPDNRSDATPSSVAIDFAGGHISTEDSAPLPAPRGKGGKGQMFVLIDPERARAGGVERWERRLAETFFRHPSTSLTSALLRAIQELNESIFEENEEGSSGAFGADGSRASLGCVVIRNDEAFFALVGRTVAYLAGPDDCDRLGRGETRPGERPLDPLGVREDVEIQMFHRVISEPWSIVLATSGILTCGDVEDELRSSPSNVLSGLRRLTASSPKARPFQGVIVSSEAPEPDDTDDDEDFDDRTNLPLHQLGPRGEEERYPVRPKTRERSLWASSNPAPRIDRGIAPNSPYRSSSAWTDDDTEEALVEAVPPSRRGNRRVSWPSRPDRPSPDERVPSRREEEERSAWPRRLSHPVVSAVERDERLVDEEPLFQGGRKTAPRTFPTTPPLRIPRPADDRARSVRDEDPELEVERWYETPRLDQRLRGVLLADTEVLAVGREGRVSVEPAPEPDGFVASSVVEMATLIVARLAERTRSMIRSGETVDEENADAETADEETAPRRSQRRRIDWARVLRAIPLDPAQLVLLGAMAVVLFFIGYLLVVVPARLVSGGAAYASAVGDIGQAEQRERNAMSQNDPVLRRRLLEEASQFAAQAHRSQPTSSAVLATEARIRGEYRAATGADVLGAPTRLVDLPAPADEMIVKGVNLFILDRANSRVFRYLLNASGMAVQSAANPVLVQRGDRLGLITVGQLTRMTWVPAGDGRSGPSLVALDADGYLVQYAPAGGLGVLALRDPSSWDAVTAMTASNGSLYALRPNDASVTQYTPRASGYDGVAKSYLVAGAHPDLTGVTEVAMDHDLYALHQNGEISRLVDGKAAPNSQDTTKLFAGPPRGLALTATSLFVGDPQGKRVVQLSRQGAFQRYLSAPENSGVLAKLRDLAVSDDGTALYILSDDAVDRLSIPALTPQ